MTRELSNDDFNAMMERGCAFWPLGHGSVMTGIATLPDGQGAMVMLAVPDDVRLGIGGDWKTAEPGKDIFRALLEGDGPASVTTFKTVEDIDRLRQTLTALRAEMQDAPK